MRKTKTPAEIREILREIKRSEKVTGLVPTMGALHQGHLSLVRMARERCDYVIVSIFVNPKQFGPKEDFDLYPRTLDKDIEILEKLGVDLLFIPGAEDIYSSAGRTGISIKELAGHLCGASRPGHFQGVMLVVAKLFNIIDPGYAFFGQKDAQQAVIIQRMAADLDFPVKIIVGPTVREDDGLALSSRNRYLKGRQRESAPALFRGLEEARRQA
ncbi:MAG: pantoate--beta-alanine ligase, partial [Candidatus Krumholzibacteriota bacterium]|nr:pantoate--beta-alanine ligase [Candidatus Krumholzibacteriota bacterium]